MPKVLLDTDILSEIMKGKDAVVADRAAAYLAVEGHLTLTSITAMEVVYGLQRKGREDKLAAFEASLSQAEVLALTGRPMIGINDMHHG